MRILNGFEEFFCLPSNLSNDDIISAFSEIGYGFWRSGLKTGVENGTFGLKQGRDLKNRAGTRPPKIPRTVIPRALNIDI